MNKRANGIAGLLDGILSGVNQSLTPTGMPPSAAAPFPTAADRPVDNPDPPRQTGSRRGRPLGKSTSPTPPKEKVTLLLSSSLAELYRDWSWEARCQFSHLVERALVDYSRRERDSHSAKR